jgi:hypothetical protein
MQALRAFYQRGIEIRGLLADNWGERSFYSAYLDMNSIALRLVMKPTSAVCSDSGKIFSFYARPVGSDNHGDDRFGRDWIDIFQQNEDHAVANIGGHIQMLAHLLLPASALILDQDVAGGRIHQDSSCSLNDGPR